MTEAVAMKARGRLLKDVLAEMAEEDIEEFMTICRKSIPKDVNFIDGVILFSILSKLGCLPRLLRREGRPTKDLYIDLNQNGIFHEMNDDGRIIKLRIGIFQLDEDREGHIPFVLPPDIARLEMLGDLEVYGCRSLPVKELSEFRYLHSLRLWACTDLVNIFPVLMDLNHVKTLAIEGCPLQSSLSPFLAWMAGHLPILENLIINDVGGPEGTDCILNALRDRNLCCQKHLKRIEIQGSSIDDSRLETLLFDIIPRFPNMSNLDLSKTNGIRSLQSIAARIKNDDRNFVVSKSIRRLNLSHNPVIKKLENDDPKEKAALMTLLQTFKSIYYLGFFTDRFGFFFGYDLEYILRINHAGRRVMNGGIPLSVWPTILERSHNKSCDIYSGWHRSNMNNIRKNPTGLYYLLRNGPALIGRLTMGSQEKNQLKRKRYDHEE